ncbi:helix-turn-helix domain-containing protein [Haloarchaeobius sp. TZWWS8]|uniref:helix-turn-helix domain-containing protein n=1 Tax=Haloarchaeobius sp. TZWWS8 TaxID=3446121 RepID=UPI003EC0AD28
MVLITDIMIPADQFALGRVFNANPDVEIELERIVPLRGAVIPLFWVEGSEQADIEAVLAADPLAEEVTVLSELEGRSLFQVVWSSEVNGLVQSLIESRAEILRATGTVNEWEFRLQFNDRERLQVFRERCVESGINMTLRRLYNPSLPRKNDQLTDDQYDIISTALNKGYWDVPRGIKLGELAALVGISDNAASQRMRRGLKTLVTDSLDTDTRSQFGNR